MGVHLSQAASPLPVDLGHWSATPGNPVCQPWATCFGSAGLPLWPLWFLWQDRPGRMEGAVQTGAEPSATIFLPSPPAARQTATVAGTVIRPLQSLKQVGLQPVLFQLLHLHQYLSRPSPAMATTDLTGSVVPSLVELSAIPTRSTGAARSMASVEAPRNIAIATLASTTAL